jgi:hypothetical protein
MIEKLQNASEAAGGFNVYTPATMPERWHFAGHEARPSFAFLLLAGEN